MTVKKDSLEKGRTMMVFSFEDCLLELENIRNKIKVMIVGEGKGGIEIFSKLKLVELFQ